MLIHNEGRYITPATLDKCFERGRILHVDKVLCGNGFSTAFLTTPPPKGKVNIIIAPNKQVLISKQAHLKSDLRIKYIYEESEDKSINNADIIMFVADSFILNLTMVYAMRQDIDRILLDEFHSIEIQSSFRRVLVRFMDAVEPFTSHSAVTTVTATPNHGAHIDIQIKNSYEVPRTINVTRNRAESVARAMNDLYAGRHVLICTNDNVTIAQFKNYDKKVTARYMIGDSLARSLVQKIIVNEDAEARLVVCSSRGFEGMDLLENDYCVYFFENRGSLHECFYISNLYQALNRPRNGVAYAEYCRQEMGTVRSYTPDEAEVMRFIERKDVSPEQKQGVKYSEYHPFVVFKTKEGGVVDVLPNDAAIRLQREKLIYDTGWSRFEDFTMARKITFIDLDEQQERLKMMRMHAEERIRLLDLNTPYIDRFSLFGDDFTCDPRRRDTFEEYLKYLDLWLTLKNYNGQRGIMVLEERIENLLKNGEAMVKHVAAQRFKKWQAEHRKEVAAKKKKEFLLIAPSLVGEFLMGLINDPIFYTSKWVAHRNYNILTMLSTENIEWLAEQAGMNIQIIDIRNCFPRLVYALAGIMLPDDFYGGYDEGRKKRKIKMNVALNNIWYDEKKATQKKVQKMRTRDGLLSMGYDWRAVDYLMDNYFDTPYKGDFFNRMAYHEKKIIGLVKAHFEELGGHRGVVRRHDSLVVFDPKLTMVWLNDFEYLGQKGWFDVGRKEPILDIWEVRDEVPF